MTTTGRTVRFFNTYEPVTTFYRDLLPLAVEAGIACEIYLSAAEYRPGRTPLRDALAGLTVRVRQMPAGLSLARGRLSKLWIMACYMTSSAVTTLFGPRDRLNFFLTQPPLFSLWGYVLKRLRGQPYCCLVMDLYPDLAVRDGLLRPGSLPTRLLTRLSRFALSHADAVLVIGRCMQEHLLRSGLETARVHLVTNWTDQERVKPVDTNPMREELGLDKSFVVLYSGNLGMSHTFDDVLVAAERLQHLSDLKFVIVGHGARRAAVEKEVARLALSNVLFLPFQPAARLSESLGLGDVHLITLRDGFEGLVVPSKAYGSLAAGKAIVYQGNARGEIARMIDESEIGIVVPLDDADALERGIVRLYNDRKQTTDMGHRARKLAETTYSREQSTGRYLDLLRNMTVAGDH